MLDLVLKGACALVLSVQAESVPVEHGSQGLGYALVLAEREPDAVQQAVLKAGIFFDAADYPAVVKAAATGLAIDPQHLELLWRSATAELWLQDGERAAKYLVRLRRAVEASTLGMEARESWLTSVATLERGAQELLAQTRAAKKALGRARITVISVGFLLVLSVLRLVKASEV